MTGYSFLCNACCNHDTDKCKDCRGHGDEWTPINQELYNTNPIEYMKNLILVSSNHIKE